jgi:hypothetical protein
MSKKLDGAIEALVDALAELPNTSLRGGSAAAGSGCASYASLVGYPGIVQATGLVRRKSA